MTSDPWDDPDATVRGGAAERPVPSAAARGNGVDPGPRFVPAASSGNGSKASSAGPLDAGRGSGVVPSASSGREAEGQASAANQAHGSSPELVEGESRPLAATRARLAAALAPVAELLAPITRAVRAALACITPLGWTTLAIGLFAWLIAAILGWREFGIAAACLLALFALCCLLLIGRTQLSVQLRLERVRVRVGETALADVQVTNEAKLPLLPIGLEFGVGAGMASFTIPTLAAGETFEEPFAIPTTERGVIVVGPARTQRGDPFGLLRRELIWGSPIELFVHPVTTPLDPVGTGLLRDLEGYTTPDVSMSDLAFHTLRDYVPGDDRRYIHWRSSAKRSTTSGQSSFLVRQFLDTRRSHVAVVVDVAPEAYADADEFEVAISAAASIALRTRADEMDLTVVAGSHVVVDPPPALALDTFSRARFQPQRLADAAARLVRVSPDVSQVAFVTGSARGFDDLQAARMFFGPNVNALGIRVASGSRVGLHAPSGITIVTIGKLTDLPGVLHAGVTGRGA